MAAVIAGGLVFIFSFVEDVGFTERFFSNPVSIVLIILATVTLPLLWMSMNRKYEWISRILAGTQLLFILGAFYAVYYPVVVMIRDGEDLTLLNSAAPDITLAYLGWALITGSLLIFPALFYLYRIFKSDKSEEVSV